MFYSVLIWLLYLFVVLYFVDTLYYARASGIALKEDRFDEWFAQPRRMWPGAGFRLYRHFKKK